MPMLKHTQVIKDKMCLRVCETKRLEPGSERLLQHLLNLKQISRYTDFGKTTGEPEVKHISILLNWSCTLPTNCFVLRLFSLKQLEKYPKFLVLLYKYVSAQFQLAN